MIGSRSKNRGLFSDARYKKYSKIVKMDSKSSAKKSVKQLNEEFEDAETHSKRERIRSVAQYAANRAEGMSQNPHYHSDTKKEMKEISEIYDDAAEEFQKKTKKKSKKSGSSTKRGSSGRKKNKKKTKRSYKKR